MSYQYNEKYSLQENIWLNEFDRAIEKTEFFMYRRYGEYEILNLISFWHDFGVWHRNGEAEEKIGQIILKKGSEPILNIGSDFIHMTPVIAQRCEQLLYEYKLQQTLIIAQRHEQLLHEYKLQRNQSENTNNDPEQIIKTEQSRNIYKLCYAPKKIGIFKASRQEYHFVDEKKPNLFKRLMNRMILANGKTCIFEHSFDKQYGLWNVRLIDKRTGRLLNEFSFRSEDSRFRFIDSISSCPWCRGDYTGICGPKQYIKAKIR